MRMAPSRLYTSSNVAYSFRQPLRQEEGAGANVTVQSTRSDTLARSIPKFLRATINFAPRVHQKHKRDRTAARYSLCKLYPGRPARFACLMPPIKRFCALNSGRSAVGLYLPYKLAS